MQSTSGNSSIIRQINEMASGLTSQGSFPDRATMFTADWSSGINPALPPLLYKLGADSLRNSYLEALQEGDEVPSDTAMDAAFVAITQVVGFLVPQSTLFKTPIVSAVVLQDGSVEVVGYFMGRLGRVAIRVDKDGACQQVYITNQSKTINLI